MSLALRSLRDCTGPSQHPACEAGVAVQILGRQRPPLAVINDHQDIAVIAVAVVRIPYEVGEFCVGLIVVVALVSARQWFGDAHRPVVAPPDPRALALSIVKRVVRRGVAEGGGHGIGTIGEGIAVSRIRQAANGRPRRPRQSARGRRGGNRRRSGWVKGQGCERRRRG